jgi:endonuclease III
MAAGPTPAHGASRNENHEYFHQLLAERTPEVVVGIDGRKAAWVRQLTDFLIAKEIETEDHLRAWLATPNHEQQLFALKDIGLKTVNYLKLLAGIQNSVAVDTHVRAFLAAAGIRPVDDRETGHIVAEAARLLGTSAAQLDASICVYRTRSASVEYQVSGR